MSTVLSPLTRRAWLRSSLGVLGGSASGWLHAVAAGAPGRQTKSVVVLWLGGGPSTIDMWDLKPGHVNGGPFRAIETTVPGLRIGEHLPKLARWGRELAVLRSMSSKEGDHVRATAFLRTGYSAQGPIHYPTLGSLVANELGSESADLPNFVSITPGRFMGETGGGFLGPKHAPLVVCERPEGSAGYATAEALTVPDTASPPGVSDAARRARLDILAGLERRFDAAAFSPVASSIQAANARAVRLMHPESAAVFRLENEPDRVRESYGRGLFGQACLLARRLVERGVSFVEVSLDGWDTHLNNFARTTSLCGTLDAAFSALLADLKDRGLLDSTLVVCQGEFGRTPKINGGGGRDHWPQAWAVAMAGCGIRAGQAVGRTTADGAAVDGTPTTVPDLIATVCRAVGVDPMKQNVSNVDRPIRIADPSARPVEALL